MPDIELTTIVFAEDDSHDDSSPDRRLLPTEQLQIAVWILEGHSIPQILELTQQHGFPSIGRKSIEYYKYKKPELLQQAREYLRNSYLTVGLAEKSNRIRALTEHAARLKAMIEETALVEEEEKTIGFGKGAQSVKQRRFAAALSKEYRDTLKQIQSEVEPIERATVVVNQQTNNNVLAGLSPEDQAQIIAGMSWTPRVMPRVVEGQALAAPADAEEEE